MPGIHLDYHFPEWDPYILSKAQGAPMIQKMAATSAEMVVVFAKCHYGNAYYNTRVGHKHKNLGDRDLLREWPPIIPKKVRHRDAANVG